MAATIGDDELVAIAVLDDGVRAQAAGVLNRLFALDPFRSGLRPDHIAIIANFDDLVRSCQLILDDLADSSGAGCVRLLRAGANIAIAHFYIGLVAVAALGWCFDAGWGCGGLLCLLARPLNLCKPFLIGAYGWANTI